MCKSKKNTNVIDSIKSPKSILTSSSSHNPSISVNFTNSKSSSVSSHASLSSLKDSLPDNPLIYQFSEISSSTNNLLSKPFSSSSSSSSWRSSIRGKDVIIFQRKLRRPILLPELKHRLSIICRSHHTTLIKLIGSSVSGNYIYLVYDYIPGVNLAQCLRNPKNPNFTVLSTWLSRIQIAADLAHGLDYIHHCSGLNSKFVHNHIKSSSIIVSDESLSPKICHFGAAELCGEIESESDSESKSEIRVSLKRSNSKKMKVEGTRGYMAPEIQSNGFVSQKSDVFAFGVVVLELISGNEALRYVMEEDGYLRVSVIETARKAVGNGFGELRKWVDRRLRDSFPVEVVEKMVVLGLECVEEDPNLRPDMGRVAGLISKLYLESSKWADGIGLPTGISVSIGPR